MPKAQNLQTLFVDLLQDIYYAEKKIFKTLPKMSKAVGKDNEELADAFMKHCEETEGQIERLEQVFELIEEKPKAKKCDAIEGIIAEGEELISEIDCKATLAAGLLATAQAVEHYEIARYGTLVAWAKLLGHDDAADLLEDTLEEEKDTNSSLNELAIDHINDAALEAQSKDEDEDEEEEERSSSRKGKAA